MSRLLQGTPGNPGLHGRVTSKSPVLDLRRNLHQWETRLCTVLCEIGPMLWPRARFDSGFVDDVNPYQDVSNWWEPPIKMLMSGVSGGYHVCGTVRFNGQIEVGVTLQMFRTSDDSYVSEAISGQAGEYVITAQTNAAHYIVAYLVGAPDKTGATVNTLIPTEARAI